ncbi:hypothetical protein JDV02_006488 [Purpureocillium takamizusanense]|uniref:Snf7 n=1 Tax=Purpureocillium takamizusanense TaxID=2060973 RepID=A0A9Q8QJI1_9HYPO|nr:uncharacterized protein JDV02_006488 [Purpureocillium takamizusanense]UNI20397.1 hypothetical protein JDV02_006488 [Purpureocillium takamizusanense]
MGELADYLVQHDANFRKARLPALYSDFRPQRTLNPDGYRANVSAWRGAIASLASSGLLSRYITGSSPLVLQLDDSLLRSLESRQFGQPLALATAVREAIANKDLLPVQEFLQSKHSIGARSWAELPWNALGWTLRQLGVVDSARGEDRLPKGRYVIVQNVDAAAAELAHRMADRPSKFDRIFTKAQFQRDFGTALLGSHVRLSDTDFEVLLTSLTRDRNMIEYDGRTIRIRGTSNELRGITEEDSAIASIKELTASLKHQTELLNARIDELGREAKTAVSRNNRVTALAALKSKKIAESSLAQRYTTLNQLEEVAAKIEQASDQVQLVKVMESSAGVLQSLNSQVGGTERVDGVVDRLREQMNDTDEVAAILADATGTVIDESEIDQQLEALEQEARNATLADQRREAEKKSAAEAEQVLKQLNSLPRVPDQEALPDRQKSPTPTSETGIGNLSLGGSASEESLKERPQASAEAI